MSGFVDEAQLHAKAGDGGAGAVSFRREAHVSRGGPDGGDGGRGGDVWLVASTARSSLLGFADHPHRRAEDGGHGRGKNKHGATGADLLVEVPVGTVVKSKAGEILADLAAPGSRWLAAEGGRPGRGNASFLSNRRRAPGFAEQGEVGEEHWYDLELRLVADAALVGFPNVGKSTLIATVSAARPKIADYPFTTLVPNLGVVRMPAGAGEFVLADVPGLIEGAASGKGLGHRFLRHVERARVLVVMVDLAEFAPADPQRQHDILISELASYNPSLAERPRVVVGSRSDMAPAAKDSWDAPSVSATTGEGITELLWAIFAEVQKARSEEARSPAEEVILHRPIAREVEVYREPDGSWRVGGRDAIRAVALSDLNDPDAVVVAQSRLRRLGVDRALSRGGARPGDVVSIGDLSFTWEPD